MGESLGEIAQHALVIGIIFFGIEAHIVGKAAKAC